MSLFPRLRRDRRLVEAALRRYLPAAGSVPLTVRRAMAYSLFPGGKRLRPILSIAACRALGGAAIEMIHTYSLIHDDLPALDNDDLRRGRATSHRVFGEAMAILAGDALLTHAFEIAASYPAHQKLAARKVRAIRLLARAAGVNGMIGGQVLDLEAEGRPYSYGTLLRIHRGKTGALISAAVQIGGIMAGGSHADVRSLRAFGDSVGLAFQIIDDILDREGTTHRLGKTIGKDARARKATFPALLGIDESRRRAREAARRATRSISDLGTRGRPLGELAHFIIERVS